MLTAVEQAPNEERFDSSPKPGMAATSTPLTISASVTLKSAGSKVLANAPAVTALKETNELSLMVVTRGVPCQNETVPDGWDNVTAAQGAFS